MTTVREVFLDSLQFRRFQPSDCDAILYLISHENWFILEKSKLEKVIRELEPVFYVLEDKSAGGQIMGTVVVCKARDGEVVLTDVIIREGFRGKGLGSFMMKNVLKLYSDVIVTLFSTTDSFYEKLGCTPCGQNAIFGDMTVDRGRVANYCQENRLDDGIRIVPFTEDRRQELVRYDAGARGYTAEKGLSLTIATSDFLAMAVEGKDRRIVGYMGNCLEPAGSLQANGFYADDPTIAAHLLRKTLNNFPDVERIRFYTLDTRQFLKEFGRLNQLEVDHRFSFGGKPVKIPGHKLYSFNQPDLCY